MRNPQSKQDSVNYVQELNWLFLSYLKHDECCGPAAGSLSEKLRHQLKAADSALLERAARLPFALFTIEIGLQSDLKDRSRERSVDPALQSLQITIVHTLWNLRQTHRSVLRTFFGLNELTISTLSQINLSDIPTIARSMSLVACQFPYTRWFWRSLLDINALSYRDSLDLIALQPRNSESLRQRHQISRYA